MTDWYTGGLTPATGSPGSSAPIRAEFAAITASFAKLPTLTGKGGHMVLVNPSGTALESIPLSEVPLLDTIGFFSDTINNGVSSFEITHATSLAPAIGIGTAIAFKAETAANVYTSGGYVGVAASAITSAAETFAMQFATKIAGAEAVRAQITSSGNFSLTSGYAYQINGTNVLSATALGTGVLASSLTSLGTIASLVATTADINAGTIDNTVIGATTPVAGHFTTLSTTGLLTTATVDINGGNADGMIIGASAAAAGNFTTLGTSGLLTAASLSVTGSSALCTSAGATNVTAHGSTWDSAGFNLASGDVYKINGSTVLSATALGSAVIGSSLTSVGTITTGVWQGTPIDQSYVVGLSGTNSGDNEQATTSVVGIMAMASSVEVSTGTVTTKAVTPHALANGEVKARSITSDTVGGPVKIDVLSQAAYDAIVSKDANTLYFIV